MKKVPPACVGLKEKEKASCSLRTKMKGVPPAYVGLKEKKTSCYLKTKREGKVMLFDDKKKNVLLFKGKERKHPPL